MAPDCEPTSAGIDVDVEDVDDEGKPKDGYASSASASLPLFLNGGREESCPCPWEIPFAELKSGVAPT
jgi:hypothetical protein